jgi:beta-amylase
MRVFLLILLCLMVNNIATAQPNPSSERVAAVMAPLSFLPTGCRDVAQSGHCAVRPQVLPYFDQLLADARNAGVNAVSVDVWWRLIEGRGDNQFDWTYYDAVFDHIHAAGLKIVPILSFHRCGTGPGDDCDFPLPDWIWTAFLAQGLTADDLKYESETGLRLDDAIPPWLSKRPEVLKQFSEVIHAFGEHYAGRATDFLEVNISLGPTGELRYPAYNGNDCWGYPDRGNFQAYSPSAQQDFRDWALARFGGLSGVASRWGLPLASVDEIRVPDGDQSASGCGQRRAQGFVDRHDYANTQYGKDLIDWYNDSLVSHGERLVREADKVLDGAMAGVPIGMKIPGVHWQMKCTPTPRIAEITAGLVQTSLNLEPVDAARSDAFGYRNVLDMVARVKGQIARPLVLHFTALEMTNAPACPLPPSGADTSMAEALVFWIAESAKDRNLIYRGENALACLSDQGWDRVTNAFKWAGYTGLTLLRLDNAELRQRVGANPPGCESWNDSTRNHYKGLISQCIATSCSFR